MPVYLYKCTVCGTVHEELRKIKDRENESSCKECFNISVLTPSTPAGINGGFYDGYSHRSGSTGVWKTDMGPQGKIGREWYGDNPHAESTLAKL